MAYSPPLPSSTSASRSPTHFLPLYSSKLQRGLSPDSSTFPSLLKALADSRALWVGKVVHGHVVKMGFASDVFVRNGLIRLYSVCKEMGNARKLFDEFGERDLVSWTILVSGYSKAGMAEEAVRLFEEMVGGGVESDAVAMATVVSACSKLGDLELGQKLHRYVDARKVNEDVVVGNALVDMYSRCGDIESAYSFFRKMKSRNVVSWNTMISGLARNGRCREALSLFRQMQGKEIDPDSATLVGVLNSCASLGALELGEWVHSYMDRKDIAANGILGNALVDMYSKCGRIDQAMKVFDGMARKDVYTFTSMIAGFAMHGQGEKALSLFSQMSSAGIKPNGVTFVGVLSACSHTGLVEAGLRHFQDMAGRFGLQPSIEHYGCVVDMLGRAGLVDEALEFIRGMPVEPDTSIWGALLGACKTHNRIALAEGVAKRLLDLEPDEEGCYVLMLNIYASSQRRRRSNHVRKVMKKKKVKKTPGCSLIEVDGTVHEFRMGHKSHPRSREIYVVAEQIGACIRDTYSSSWQLGHNKKCDI